MEVNGCEQMDEVVCFKRVGSKCGHCAVADSKAIIRPLMETFVRQGVADIPVVLAAKVNSKRGT